MSVWAHHDGRDQPVRDRGEPARQLFSTLLAVFVRLDSELYEDAMALLVELVLGDLAFGMALTQHAELLHEGILVWRVHGGGDLLRAAALASFPLGCLLF